MSKYILVPVDALEVVVGNKEADEHGNNMDTVLECIDAEVAKVNSGESLALTPYDLGLLLSISLKQTVTKTTVLGDRLTKFLWGTMGAELKSKKVL